MPTKYTDAQFRSLWNKAQNARVPRRQFLTLLATGGAAGLAACTPPPTSEGPTTTPVSTATAMPPTAGGYSIFYETMVDIPWPEVDKAAAEEAKRFIEAYSEMTSASIEAFLNGSENLEAK